MKDVNKNMERLTDKNFRIGFDDSNELPSYVSIYEKLRNYEDLEEQGKLLKLPVPDGSLGYEPYRFLEEGAWEINVHKIRLEDLDKIGKTVFVSPEEAENYIKEMV